MRGNTWLALTLATGLGIAAPLAAQQTTLSGQVRPRYEHRDPQSPSDAGPDEFTSMRVRLGLQAEIDPSLSVFIQMQDVRVFGEESHPLFDFSADHLDLHQGYMRYSGQKLDWLTATIGRMETTFAEHRLVGNVNWAQQGQSFDGIRLDIARSRADVAVIFYQVNDETAPAIAVDRGLYGAYATVADVGPGDLDLYWLYNRAEGAAETDEHSVGARYAFTQDRITARVEGTLQTGTRDGSDVSAFMLGARVGTRFADGRAGVTLWYDYLSGDDAATGDVEVFNTLYGTNHAFYGFADLFLNIPVHTAGAGLQDLAVKLAWDPTEDVRVGADLHSFRAAEQGALSGSHFGEELDLTLTHRYSENLAATAGFSLVVQDDPFAEIGRLSENMTWFYLMLNATF